MGKFDNILLCTDLDDTLLTTDKRVSEENRREIEYFKKEGGFFTFATGRVTKGARLLLEYVEPNAPIICFNGAGIYDFAADKMLWSKQLDKDAVAVLDFVDKNFPQAGIEVCTHEQVYFAKVNRLTRIHQIHEHFPDNPADFHDIDEPWTKVIFMLEIDEIPLLSDALLSSPFADKYTFIRSSPHYYELLPKNADKGAGLLKLAEILNIPPENTVGMGDNENDIGLVTCAGAGVAVANAIDSVKSAADYITVDNNSHTAAAVIHAIERGKIKLGANL